MKTTTQRSKNECGAAMIVTLIFLVTMGVLSTALVFTVQNEMKTSSAYKYSRQAYYVASAGVQNAVQWFITSYQPYITTPSTYDMTTLPVEFSGNSVLLAGFTGDNAAYPDSTVAGDFTGNFRNVLLTGDANNQGRYSVNATLLRHQPRTFIDPTTFISYPSAIERWRINSSGRWGTGATPLGRTEITAVIENSGNALFDRALWGIDSVDLTGATKIDSYDPRLDPEDPNNRGNLGSVGTNGIVTRTGNAKIYGDVAYYVDTNIGETDIGTYVFGDLIPLSSPRYFPPIPSFEVGDADKSIKPGDSLTLDAEDCNEYRNITVKGDLIFAPGTYYINELNVTSQGRIIVSDTTTLFVQNKLTMNGQGVLNEAGDPTKLTIFYNGVNDAITNGGAGAYVEIYAPNADLVFAGGAELYGSFIGKTISSQGNFAVHFSEGSLNNNLIQRQFRLITWAQDTF